MKYLIVSDIHGSLPALEQVLAFYREQQCGMLCILGDILNYGPRNGIPQGLDPKGIAERLNAMAGEIVAIRGNCDSEVDQMQLDFPILLSSQHPADKILLYCSIMSNKSLLGILPHKPDCGNETSALFLLCSL